jgi:hypothetical protein
VIIMPRRIKELLIKKGLGEKEFKLGYTRNRITVKIEKPLKFLPHNILYDLRKQAFEIGKPILVSLPPYIHEEEILHRKNQKKKHIKEIHFSFPFLYGYRQKALETSWERIFTPRDFDLIFRHVRKHGFMNVWSSLREAVWKYHVAHKIETHLKEPKFYDNVLTKTREIGKEMKKNRWKTWFKKDMETEIDLLAVRGKKGYLVEILTNPTNKISQKAEVWNQINYVLREKEGVNLIPWIFVKNDIKRVRRQLRTRFPEFKVTKLDELIKERSRKG